MSGVKFDMKAAITSGYNAADVALPNTSCPYKEDAAMRGFWNFGYYSWLAEHGETAQIRDIAAGVAKISQTLGAFDCALGSFGKRANEDAKIRLRAWEVDWMKDLGRAALFGLAVWAVAFVAAWAVSHILL